MPKLSNDLAEKAAQELAKEAGEQVKKRVVELLASGITEEMTDAIAQDVATAVGPKVYSKVLKNIKSGDFTEDGAAPKGPKKTRKASGEGAPASGAVALTADEQKLANELLKAMGNEKRFTTGELGPVAEAAASSLGVAAPSKDAVKNIIKALRASNQLGTEGHARGTKYFVKQLSLPVTPVTTNGTSGVHPVSVASAANEDALV